MDFGGPLVVYPADHWTLDHKLLYLIFPPL